jgi:hypothetical protein
VENMAAFYYDTCTKMREIFSEHCNLSMEQYEWIGGEFIFLVADIQEEEDGREIDKRVAKMKTVFDFLMETKELTLAEHNALHNLAIEVSGADPRILTNSGVKLD